MPRHVVRGGWAGEENGVSFEGGEGWGEGEGWGNERGGSITQTEPLPPPPRVLPSLAEGYVG